MVHSLQLTNHTIMPLRRGITLNILETHYIWKQMDPVLPNEKWITFPFSMRINTLSPTCTLFNVMVTRALVKFRWAFWLSELGHEILLTYLINEYGCNIFTSSRHHTTLYKRIAGMISCNFTWPNNTYVVMARLLSDAIERKYIFSLYTEQCVVMHISYHMNADHRMTRNSNRSKILWTFIERVWTLLFLRY